MPLKKEYGGEKMKLSEVVEVIIMLLMAIGISMIVATMIPIPAIRTPIGILFFLLITFGLLYFGKVKEGTAIAIERFGGFKKCVMAWKGNKLDEDCNVEKGETFQLPGGLRLFGIRGIDKPHKYHFRWYSVELRAGEEPKVQFKDVPDMDYILVKPDTYWSKITNAETKDGMVVDIEFLDTIRVINPRKALFVAPPNWLENTLSRLNALRTGWVRGKTFDYIRKIRKDPQKLWRELGNDPLIQKTFKEEWGIQIEENGMQIYKINLLPEYQAALARAKQMELETSAKIPIEEKEREAEKIELQHVRDRAIEIRDGVGLTPKDAIEIVQTERGKVTKHIIEYKGLEGVRGLPLITIGGERMPMGKSHERLSRKKFRKEKKRKPVSEMSDEEVIEEAERIAKELEEERG
jgi:hypothetical protein